MTAASVTAFFALNVDDIFSGRLLGFVITFYCCMSMMTFIVYAADKAAAKNGQWRIKEKTLHLLALGGGWPGALAAQRILRHKSSKPAFRAIFRITVAGNGILLVVLLTMPALRFAG